MQRRRFAREFKLQAAWLIRERGVSCAQASEDPKSAPDLAAQLGEGACG